jgi:tRNA(Ile)-lysidine synthase
VEASVRAAVARFVQLLPAGAVGVVAVSGGPDSVALLRALAMECASPLVVAHLNHQLRGQESDADELFVRELHSSLVASGAGLLPCCCERIDVLAAAAGDNLESAARNLRYDWLLQVARATGAAWIATGHTADDQAETVLHRLLRGTGLHGLGAIPRRRELAPGISLERPLLGVRRHQVLAFLNQLGQSSCQDSTNSDRRFMRSRLRHDLLPLLSNDFNPAVVDVLCRLAEQAAHAQVFIDLHAGKLLAEAELPRAGRIIVLDARPLQAAHAALLCEALRLLWERENWPLSEMGFERWQQVATVVLGACPAADLPGGVRVRRVGHVVQLQMI